MLQQKKTLTIVNVVPNNFDQRVLQCKDDTGKVWEAGVLPIHTRPVGEVITVLPGESYTACLLRYGGKWVVSPSVVS